MVFKISDFKNAIGNIARPNLFEANIQLNNSISSLPAYSKVDGSFKFRCETAEHPGRTLATMDDAVGAGPALKLPYDVTYNDISLTIICSEDMAEKEFFESWFDFIIGAPGVQLYGKSASGLVNFHENYAEGNILEISQLNTKGEALSYTQMYDVYPIAMTAMTASWEDTNTYQRFGVTMSYRYYEHGVLPAGTNQR